VEGSACGSMGKTTGLGIKHMNRDMDVFFLKPKKNLLICWLKLRMKSREQLHCNSHVLKNMDISSKDGRGTGSSGKGRLKEYYWFGSKKRYTYPVELKRSLFSLRRYELFKSLFKNQEICRNYYLYQAAWFDPGLLL